MKNHATTLERAFELARSGACATVTELRHKLRAEGYSDRQLEGPYLLRQLRQILRDGNAKAPAAAIREDAA